MAAVRILVDVHERQSHIGDVLVEELGAEVELVSLPAGDYFVGADTLVERKRVLDLHGAVIKGRLWPQLAKLRAAAARDARDRREHGLGRLRRPSRLRPLRVERPLGRGFDALAADGEPVNPERGVARLPASQERDPPLFQRPRPIGADPGHLPPLLWAGRDHRGHAAEAVEQCACRRWRRDARWSLLGYDEEKAVVMNPRDFRRLLALDGALDAIQAIDAPALTQLVLEAHRLEDEPDEPVEDPKAIRALLGL